MSELTSIFSKALTFFGLVATKTAAVDKTFLALGPATKAAVLATFYDVSKTIASASEVAADAAAGNVTGAITVSAATFALVQNVLTDSKEDFTTLQGLVSALKADVAA